jgi:hypothetical protein
MFFRGIYKSYLKPDIDFDDADRFFVVACERLLNDKSINAISLFRFGKIIALYYESSDKEPDVESLLKDVSDNLCCISEESHKIWTRMWELFHFSSYVNPEQWERTLENKQGIMRVNRLKYDTFSSYVYYHYQLQEEHPGFGDKYGIICFDDGLMCFYLEEPTEIEKSPARGKLSTDNSPLERWNELMGQHFIPWEDTDKPWKDMKTIYSYIKAK